MDFINALKKTYFDDPCGVLSIPIWKVREMLDDCENVIRVDQEGNVVHLEAWTRDQLQIYWDRVGEWAPSAPETAWRTPSFAVVHAKYASHLSLSQDYTVQRFFRLSLTEEPFEYPLPGRFRFEKARLPEEAVLVGNVIGRSYAHMRPDLSDVIGWIRQPVFDPDLWVWIIDQITHQPAGLGIAEIDREEGEASLEWIQILPEYRGQGLAKALVTRLARQLKSRVPVVTVSGEADNPSDAEHLYRRCGFSGQDVWWVIRRLG
jgi:ribosomal protein S18 acetylase RimI-like enzyme